MTTAHDIVTVDPNAPRISASLCVASYESATAKDPALAELAEAEAEVILADLAAAGVEVNEHTLHAFNRGFLLAYGQVDSTYFPLALAINPKGAIPMLSALGRATAGAMALTFGATSGEAEALLEEFRALKAAEEGSGE